MQTRWNLLFLFITIVALIFIGCGNQKKARQSEQAATKSEQRVVQGTVLKVNFEGAPEAMDAPRIYDILLKTDQGDTLHVKYRALPPSPVREAAKIRLAFHAGVIKPGHYLIAKGEYQKNDRVVWVKSAGDFIETRENKP